MFWFWSIVAVIFLIAEIMTFTFGFIFITFGALIITLLLGVDIISNSDLLSQLLIIMLFAVIGFCFFYRSFKKSKTMNINNFKEDMLASVIDEDLKRDIEGKIKWSGTICNAIMDSKSNYDVIEIGSIVIIKEFKGNIAIVDKVK